MILLTFIQYCNIPYTVTEGETTVARIAYANIYQQVFSVGEMNMRRLFLFAPALLVMTIALFIMLMWSNPNMMWWDPGLSIEESSSMRGLFNEFSMLLSYIEENSASLSRDKYWTRNE